MKLDFGPQRNLTKEDLIKFIQSLPGDIMRADLDYTMQAPTNYTTKTRECIDIHIDIYR